MHFKHLIMLFLFLSIDAQLSADEKKELNNPCSAWSSDRESHKDVLQKNKYDLYMKEVFKLPVFSQKATLDKIKSDLIAVRDLKINCISMELVYFSLVWNNQPIDGFYRIKQKKYWSGPFSSKEIKSIVMVDPNSASGLIKNK